MLYISILLSSAFMADARLLIDRKKVEQLVSENVCTDMYNTDGSINLHRTTPVVISKIREGYYEVSLMAGARNPLEDNDSTSGQPVSSKQEIYHCHDNLDDIMDGEWSPKVQVVVKVKAKKATTRTRSSSLK